MRCRQAGLGGECQALNVIATEFKKEKVYKTFTHRAMMHAAVTCLNRHH